MELYIHTHIHIVLLVRHLPSQKTPKRKLSDRNEINVGILRTLLGTIHFKDLIVLVN